MVKSEPVDMEAYYGGTNIQTGKLYFSSLTLCLFLFLPLSLSFKYGDTYEDLNIFISLLNSIMSHKFQNRPY